MKLKWTLTLSIQQVRRLIMVALLLVVFTNLAYFVKDAWNNYLAGFIWGISAAVVTFFCRMRAGKQVQANKQYYLWLAVPAVITIVPIFLKIYDVFKGEEGSRWWNYVWDLAPVFITFLIPVSLLWLAYAGLEGHIELQEAPVPETDKDSINESS